MYEKKKKPRSLFSFLFLLAASTRAARGNWRGRGARPRAARDKGSWRGRNHSSSGDFKQWGSPIVAEQVRILLGSSTSFFLFQLFGVFLGLWLIWDGGFGNCIKVMVS